ncbi:MAG: thiol:disulfide interchange protein DsbA/DsbL [Thiomargarita sp.]|nr:thiol:disulfide interchange protein DsbA/DsbL [Thiomargarita sp.]
MFLSFKTILICLFASQLLFLNTVIADEKDNPFVVSGFYVATNDLPKTVIEPKPIETENPFAGDYQILESPQTTGNPDKVEVLELFWYTCPHCYSFEQGYLSQWREEQMPEYVDLVQMPAVYNKNDKYMPLAKAYFVAKELDILDKIHIPLFAALHDKKRSIYTEEAIRDFFVKHGGITKEQFNNSFHNSFSLDTNINKAYDTTKNYKIRGVPIIFVNGKYRLGGTISKGYKNMMQVINYLVAEEYKLIQERNAEVAVD